MYSELWISSVLCFKCWGISSGGFSAMHTWVIPLPSPCPPPPLTLSPVFSSVSASSIRARKQWAAERTQSRVIRVPVQLPPGRQSPCQQSSRQFMLGFYIFVIIEIFQSSEDRNQQCSLSVSPIRTMNPNWMPSSALKKRSLLQEGDRRQKVRRQTASSPIPAGEV